MDAIDIANATREIKRSIEQNQESITRYTVMLQEAVKSDPHILEKFNLLFKDEKDITNIEKLNEFISYLREEIKTVAVFGQLTPEQISAKIASKELKLKELELRQFSAISNLFDILPLLPESTLKDIFGTATLSREEFEAFLREDSQIVGRLTETAIMLNNSIEDINTLKR